MIAARLEAGDVASAHEPTGEAPPAVVRPCDSIRETGDLERPRREDAVRAARRGRRLVLDADAAGRHRRAGPGEDTHARRPKRDSRGLQLSGELEHAACSRAFEAASVHALKTALATTY